MNERNVTVMRAAVKVTAQVSSLIPGSPGMKVIWLVVAPAVMRAPDPVTVQRMVRSAFWAAGTEAVPVAVVAAARVGVVVITPAVAGSTTVTSAVAVNGWAPATVTTQVRRTVPAWSAV